MAWTCGSCNARDATVKEYRLASVHTANGEAVTILLCDPCRDELGLT